MIKNEPKKYVGDYNVDAVRDAYENKMCIRDRPKGLSSPSRS